MARKGRDQCHGLVVTGEEKSGRSTLIEGLYTVLEKHEAPMLWVDATPDCGVLRKLKGEASLKQAQGKSLLEALETFRQTRPSPGPEVDWQLAELAYLIRGTHEGLSFYPHVLSDAAAQGAQTLEDAYLMKVLAYGWPRLMNKNYRFMVMNGWHNALISTLLPHMMVDVLTLTTPTQPLNPERIAQISALGPWHSCNVLMTQASPEATLHESWQAHLARHPNWRFLGKLPYYADDAHWQQAYLPALKSALLRLNWAGVAGGEGLF